jgi:hypothetical protein
MTRRADQTPSWPQFAAWAGCGASATLILVGAFTFGPLAIVPAAVFAGIALLLGGTNLSAVGAASGVGVWGLVVAWLNRGGPGESCVTSTAGITCTQRWAPWPFWVAGILLVVTPMIVFGYLRRRLHRAPTA